MLFAAVDGSNFAIANAAVAQQNHAELYSKKLGCTGSPPEKLSSVFHLKIPCVLKFENAFQIHFVLKNDKDFSNVNSYAKLYAENFSLHYLKTENEIQRIQNIYEKHDI